MVVAHGKHIDFREILGRIDIRACKRAVDKPQWRSVAAEHGVDENAAAAELHEKARMAKPDHGILLARQGQKIRLLCRQGISRHQAFLITKQKFPRGYEAVFMPALVFRHDGHGYEVLKMVPMIMRRGLHAF